MAKLIGTAGHVDHGKTTLIKALTGIDADRLPEEKKRGLTIDIGFAHIDFPGIGQVSIVDVPGHERFLTNMLVGALGIDVALLCVAADESVMPQTREHFQILQLLPVDKMVVALTRADLADEIALAISQEEVTELLAGTRFEGSPVIPVSAFTGDGLPLLRQTLASLLGAPEAVTERRWYLPIDRVFTVKGHGAVVTGTLAQGVVKEGDEAVLVPGGTRVRVRSIQHHDHDVEFSEKGKRTALNLSGVKAEDIERGMTVSALGVSFETSILDAKVDWLVEPKHGLRVRVSIGADEVIGKQFLSTSDPSMVQLRFERATAAAVGQPLIVRRYSPPDLLAGGRVVVPQAKARRKTETTMNVEGENDASRILQLVNSAPFGMPTDEICRLLGRSPQSLGDDFERLKGDGSILGFAGLWVGPAVFEKATSSMLAALMSCHEAEPTRAFQPREKVVSAAKLPWIGKPLDRMLAAIAESGKVIVQGTTLRHPSFAVQLGGRQRELLDKLKANLESAGPNVPGVNDLAKALFVPTQAIDDIMRVGLDAGELTRIGDGLVYTTAQLLAMARRTASLFGTERFPASEFRERFETSRKYAIPILEYFDSKGYTIRQGDQRVVQKIP